MVLLVLLLGLTRGALGPSSGEVQWLYKGPSPETTTFLLPALKVCARIVYERQWQHFRMERRNGPDLGRIGG